MVWAVFYSRLLLRVGWVPGEIRTPGRSSIAHVLLTQWYGSDLPEVPEDTGRNWGHPMGQ